MFKKLVAAVLAAAFAVVLAGCSGEYVMTEDDIAIQRAIEGFWIANYSTGYNSYDENGNATALLVVEFTDNFRYFLHRCDLENAYVMTYDPISYTFENKKFKVNVDGTASYAAVAVSGDGQNMYWITDERTDQYDRLTEEEARALGIPEHDSGDVADTDNSENEEASAGESAEE